MLSCWPISPYRTLIPILHARIQQAIDIKTKPPGSLGRIEELALKIALCQKSLQPSADPARLFIFAGDHGLTEEGVSAWPSEVTTQMVLNFLPAALQQMFLLGPTDVEITVVDAGIIGDLPDHENLVRANIRKGTRNAMQEDAMSQRGTAKGSGVRGCHCKQSGSQRQQESSFSAKWASATLPAPPCLPMQFTALTSKPSPVRARALDADGVNRKTEILKRVASRKPGLLDAETALAAFGGLEIACIAGAVIGAASAGALVLVDGFIASAGAMCALKARPEAAAYTVFSHRSKEPGHRAMMEAIGEEPLIDLDLRLGEGTGRASCAAITSLRLCHAQRNGHIRKRRRFRQAIAGLGKWMKNGRQTLGNSYNQIAFVIRFFTRLPLPGDGGHSGELSDNALWFPVAGLVVGLITGIFWLLLAQVLPPFLAAGLTLGVGVLITGGLHEDGFADCADGLGGGPTKERALEIMRDSRIGAYGAIALIFSIGLRWAALASLGPWSGFFALLIAHCVSRAAITLPLALSTYARQQGLGKSVAGGISRNTLYLVIGIALLVAFLGGALKGLIAAILALATGWLFMKRLDTRLGGYTGDGLGAIQQVSEMTVLLVLATGFYG